MPSPNIFQRPPARPAPAARGALPEALMAQVRQARVLQENGHSAQAASVYRGVLKVYPRQYECLLYLGVAEHAEGRLEEAVELLQQASDIAPAQAAAHANLGAVLLAQGRLAPALASLERAVALKPESAEAHANRAWALHLLHRPAEAIAAIDRAIGLQGTRARYRLRQAQILHGAGRHEAARAALERLALEHPQDADAFANLATTQQLMGDAPGARASLERALSVRPGECLLQLRHAAAWLPLALDTDEDPQRACAHCAEELEAIEARLDGERIERPESIAGQVHPYYLAYLDGDQRALISRFGRINAALMAQWNSSRQAARAPRGTETRQRLRLGIVSAQVRSHSVWNAITRGWVGQIDRTRFEVVIFSLSPMADAETDWAREHAQAFIAGPHPLADWVRRIEEAACDVLIYPEIGMDPLTARLACLRLAPVQAASWGHPQTTGLPTLDAYLSAADMEPEDADAHYTESLIRLPGLGCSFEPPATPGEADPPGLALQRGSAGAPCFVCPGTPYKYTPRHDTLFLEIARALPDARFLFFREEMSAALADRTMARMRRTFAGAGLEPDTHLHLVPWQSPAEFQRTLRRSTAMLDTVGFSGFNTVMHAVASDAPVVTLRGRSLRGRLGSAIIERLGLPVAHDDASYVKRAIELATETQERAATIARQTAGRDGLYRDPAPVRALERWMDEATGRL